MKISVIGAGNRGLALSDVLAYNKHEVLVYSREKGSADEINNNHFSSKYLHGIKINESIKATENLKECLEFSNILLIAVPSTAIPHCLREIKEIKDCNEYFFINSTKGLNLESKKTVQQIISDFFPVNKGLVSLLGPSFAKNVILKDLTCISAISSNKDEAIFVQNIFSNNYFRVYTNNDVIGAEVYSSMKNAFAIASGILAGLGYHENAKASLITLGAKELGKIGNAMGAKPETVFGLTGIGDLTLTCSSQESRNFQAGFQIGQANSFEGFTNNDHITVEGLNAISVFEEIAQDYNLDLPILHGLYLVTKKNQKPSEVISLLMKRPLEDEVSDFL